MVHLLNKLLQHDNLVCITMHLVCLKLGGFAGLRWEERYIFNEFSNKLARKHKTVCNVDLKIHKLLFKKEVRRFKRRIYDIRMSIEFNGILEKQYNNMIAAEASNKSIQKNYKELYEFIKANTEEYDATPMESLGSNIKYAKKTILYFCDYLLDDQFNLSWIQCHDTARFDITIFQNKEITKKYEKLGVRILNDYSSLKKQSFDYVIDCNGYLNFNKSLYSLNKRIGKFHISAFNDLLPISSPHIDYIMSYDYLVEGLDKNKFLVLPDKCIIGLMPLPKTELPTKLPCESNKYITFGNASSPIKINRMTVELWSSVLYASKNSKIKLIHPLYKYEEKSKKILELFNEFKIDRSRVIFSDVGSYPYYLKEFKNVDIHIASYPLAGGRILTQSLSEGYFSVNLEKKDHVFSRLSGMFASALGIEEFTTQDPEEFKRICLELANNPAKIKEVRLQVRDKVIAFNKEHPGYFAREVENKLLSLAG